MPGSAYAEQRLRRQNHPFERLAAFYGERARGGAGPIVTGGYAPNQADRIIEEGGPIFHRPEEVPDHRLITRRVHDEGGKILLQILHTGRYAKDDSIVGVSDIRSRINRRVPRVLASEEIGRYAEDYANATALAREAYGVTPGFRRHGGRSPCSSASPGPWGGAWG